MYRLQITQIANILSLNYQRANTPGLINGYLGASFFFYYYARYTGLHYYEDVAGKLLDEVMQIDVKRMPKTFAEGVYGIGWLIRRLVKENYIEEDGELKMFEELSQQKYTEKEIYFEQMVGYPVASKFFLQPETSPIVEQRLIDNMEIILNWKGRANGATFWISVTIHVIKNAFIYEKHGVLRKYQKILENRLFECVQTGCCTKQDMFIISYLREVYGWFPEIEKALLDIQFDLLYDVYMNWQTVIYDDLIELKDLLPNKYLNKYLSEINFNISEKNISMDGMCSLGINLMKKLREY